VLALNIPSILRQLVSLPQIGAEVPGALSPVKAAWEFLRITGRGAFVFGNPITETWKALLQDPVYTLMKKHSSIHLHDPIDFEYVAMQDAQLGKLRIHEGSTLRDMLMFPQRGLDMMVRMAAWKTAYDYELDRLSKDVARPTAAILQKMEKDAAAFADDSVNRGQEPMNVANRNMAQTGPEMLRSMIPFTGQPMVNFDYIRNHIARPIVMAFNDGGTYEQKLVNIWQALFVTPPEGSQTTVAKKVFFSMIVPALAMGLIARGRKQKDSDEVLMDIFAYSLGYIPIIGPVISAAIMADVFFETGAPMYSDLLSTMGEVAYNIKKRYDNDGADSKDLIDNMMYATQFIGFPRELVRQLERWRSGFWETYGLSSDSLSAAFLTRQKTDVQK
jgi:hypothetical protein